MWDGARTMDGAFRYIGKSFCDGNDTRRYANISLIVAQYCLLKETKPFWDKSDWIYEQVRWGLDGVLTFLGDPIRNGHYLEWIDHPASVSR